MIYKTPFLLLYKKKMKQKITIGKSGQFSLVN